MIAIGPSTAVSGSVLAAATTAVATGARTIAGENGNVRRDRRANPMGAYLATAGVVVFLIATFLDWVAIDQDVTGSGYEVDTSIPQVAFLGVGLAAAVRYALNRARDRQHRGLSLTTMAAGVAATLLAVSYILDAPAPWSVAAT